jgi:ankyrin repeat protein
MRAILFVPLMLLSWAAAHASPVLEAAQAANEQAALALLRDGQSATAVAPDGTTALHWAAHHGSHALAAALIEAGADVNARTPYGVTPMSEAAARGDAALIAMLLDAGADVESANADGQTALMSVARGAHLEAAKVLLKRGANVNAVEQWRGQNALMWAAAQSQPEMVELLLKNGASPDARSAVNENARQITAEPRAMYRPAGGLTPLIFAARAGCIECARALIKGGATVDLEDPEGVTPLLVALDNLHFDLAAFLLSAGADPNKWDWRGRSPLYLAIDMNTLPHGGRPDRPSFDRLTGLDVARLLLKAGANPNLRLKLHPGYREVKDDRGADRMLTIGTTPLLRAAKAFDVDAIQLLLEHGADTELANVNGITPLMAAAGLASRIGDTRGVYDSPDVEQRSLAAVRLLLAAGANVNARARDGRTAATGAATWGWKEVSAALAAAGAEAPAKAADGTTRGSRTELAQQ